jgi:hypothetical protein
MKRSPEEERRIEEKKYERPWEPEVEFKKTLADNERELTWKELRIADDEARRRLNELENAGHRLRVIERETDVIITDDEDNILYQESKAPDPRRREN